MNHRNIGALVPRLKFAQGLGELGRGPSHEAQRTRADPAWAETLCGMMKKCHINCLELSERTGIPVRTLRRYRTGATSASSKRKAELEEALACAT